MDMDLVFVGTSGSVPTAKRGLPGLLLRHGGTRILFDCGEGTQRQLSRSVGLVELDAIFITHFHADHWLGLPGLLKTLDLRERERPLEVFGPPGLGGIFDLVEASVGTTRFEVIDSELEAGEEIDFPGLFVTPFEVKHRGTSFGYLIHEPDRPGRVDLDRAAALGLQPGPVLGRLQRGETVDGVRPEDVLGEPRRGRRVVISGDTAPCSGVAAAADGCDVLIHEATFADDSVDRAEAKAHSTARQAARIAADAGAGLLALTHLSSRYSGWEHKKEAREEFERTWVARDFDSVVVPVPERGEPTFLRWKDRKLQAQPDPGAGETGIVA